ncbi:unnamed protein product [Macrosiphum euphorbiae]|uniref:Uncharacterized protein n=1 Tax=Macrosiphum euphorbiae TaxID=13131 RepID=A0AAV0WBV8_9HEMI|nr:unnamed protein product [Macrosiphum euphorbiae]
MSRENVELFIKIDDGVHTSMKMKIMIIFSMKLLKEVCKMKRAMTMTMFSRSKLLQEKQKSALISLDYILCKMKKEIHQQLR